MEMNPAHLARGGHLARVAAEHVHDGWRQIRSVDPVPGIFGTTRAGTNVDAVLSRTHGHHLQALGEHVGRLQWVAARAADIVSAFDRTDQDAGRFITKAGSFEK